LVSTDRAPIGIAMIQWYPMVTTSLSVW
jgi:hypothetical protein